MPQFVKAIHYPPLIRTATQYSYDENNRLTRWVYTIPTLSRTAMHYAYNTDTTDTVPDGVLVDVTLFDTNRVLYRYDYLQRQSNKIIKEKPGQNESVEDQRTILEERFAYSTDTENNSTIAQGTVLCVDKSGT